MIATLKSLRDIGNTVIVVEHDEDTIRAADHLVEMGPGPGVHGGEVVVQGALERPARAASGRPPGSSSSGAREIETPARRRPGQRQGAHRPQGAREQPEERGRGVPARQAHRRHRRVGVGQEHAGERDSLQGAVEAAGGHAHAARRPRRRGRPRARPQGGQHRPVADRPQQPLEPGHLRRLLRHHPRPVHRGAAVGGARLQAGAIQLQRQGRPLRGVPGRRRHHHAALLHARRRGDLRRLQGRALQRRDARGHAARQDHRRHPEHVDRGGRRVLRERSRWCGASSRSCTRSASAT